MGLTYVQSAVAVPSPGTSGSIAFGSSTTGSSFLLLLVTWTPFSGAPTITSITDTLGNTYVRLATAGSSGFTGQCAVYSVPANKVSGGANTVTVNFSGATGFTQLGVAEYTGQAAANPIDFVSSMIVSLSTATPSLQPAASNWTNETVIGLGYQGVNSASTPGSGYTIRAGSSSGFCLFDKNVSATGSNSLSVTNSSTNWNLLSITVKSSTSTYQGWALKQAQFYDGSGTSITSSPLTITAGDLVVLNVRYAAPGSTTISVMDTLGNTYTAVPSANTFNPGLFGGYGFVMFYCPNAIGGTGTITASFGVSTIANNIDLLEYAGMDTVSGLDSGTGATNFSNGGTASVTVTTAFSDDLVIGFIVNSSGGISSSSITDRTGNFLGSNGAMGEFEKTPAGAFNVTANGTPSAWNAVAAAFKISSGGPVVVSSGIVFIIT